MTDKIEGSPSKHKPFGSGVTRRIFSLRSRRSKMPLGVLPPITKTQPIYRELSFPGAAAFASLA